MQRTTVSAWPEKITILQLELIKTEWEFNNRGVPQGSVPGLLLFNIFLNDLFLFVTTVKLIAYTDDQQMFSVGQKHEELYHLLNSELCVAVDWFRNNGMFTNPDKF